MSDVAHEILIVESDQPTAELYRRELSRDCHVFTCTDEPAALHLLRTRTISAVVLEPALSGGQRWLSGETMLAWLFILPSLIGFAVFYAYPAVRGLLISFTNWDLLSTPRSVGLANYQKLFGDPQFWQSLGVTVYYVLLNIPLQT